MTITDSTTARPGRPIQLSLEGVIDPASINRLRQTLLCLTVAPRIILDCGSVTRVDPVGAALLWQFCGELEREFGSVVSLFNLPPSASYRLRSHPLIRYVTIGEELFQNPFEAPLPSNR